MSMDRELGRHACLLAIVVISWILFYNCFYQPLRAETARIAAGNAGLRKQLGDHRNRSVNRMGSREATNHLVALHQENLRQVPGEPDKGGLLVYLAEKAEATGVRLASVQEEDRSSGPGEPFPRYQLSCRLEGNCDNIWTFLREVETGQRLVRIERMRLYGRGIPEPDDQGFVIPTGRQVPAASNGNGHREEPGAITREGRDSGTLVCEFTLVVYFDPGSPKLE